VNLYGCLILFDAYLCLLFASRRALQNGVSNEGAFLPSQRALRKFRPSAPSICSAVEAWFSAPILKML
jgi:hypothetical protein